MPLHNHLMVNGFTLFPPQDTKLAEDWMKSLVESIGMKIVQGPFASYVDKEGNRGLTIATIIETSHIAMHVWDEPDPALVQFDLYTCSTLDVEMILKNLQDSIGLFNYQTMVVERKEGFKIIPEDKWIELA